MCLPSSLATRSRSFFSSHSAQGRILFTRDASCSFTDLHLHSFFQYVPAAALLFLRLKATRWVVGSCEELNADWLESVKI
ncbi:hypothetical protein KC326_g88 [Hortaea werneckii]|nr:hypothetical protein KC326_g88 [Hortaea werneckii]